MSKHLQKPVTKTGAPMTLAIAKGRLDQAISLCSEEDLREARDVFGLTREEIRRRFKLISAHDVEGLEEYYEMAERPARPRGVDLDELVETLWARVEKRLDARLAMYRAEMAPPGGLRVPDLRVTPAIGGTSSREAFPGPMYSA